MNDKDIDLRLLVDTKDKILVPGIKSTKDRIRALGKGTGDAWHILRCTIENMEDMLGMVDRGIMESLEDNPLAEEALKVPACTPYPLASVLAYIPHPEDYDTVSALWSYAGFNPNTDNFRFNPSARTAVYELAKKLVQGNNMYRELYRSKRRIYLSRDWEEGHANLAALRFVAKTFLIHLHETARTLAGKSTGYERAVELHGEDNIYHKEDYGWK